MPVCDLTIFSSERLPCILLTCGKHLHDHIIPEEGRFEPVYHIIHMLSFCQVVLFLCHIMLFICHHVILCHPCVIMTYLSICHHDIMLSMFNYDICCICVIVTCCIYVIVTSCCSCVILTYHVVHVS